MHYMCVMQPVEGMNIAYRSGHSRDGRTFFQFDNVGDITPWRVNPAPMGSTVLVMDKGDGRVEIASKVPIKLKRGRFQEGDLRAWRGGRRMVLSAPDQVLGMVLTPPAVCGPQCDAHAAQDEDPAAAPKMGWLARLRHPQWRQKWKSNLEELAGGVMFCVSLLGLMFLASIM